MRKIILTIIIFGVCISILVIGIGVMIFIKNPITIIGNRIEFGKSDRQVAEEYVKNNEELRKKYGENFKYILDGGGGTGENEFGFTSGKMLYEYIISNDKYNVYLEKKKLSGWHVTGIICTSAKYICDEIQMSFCGSDRFEPTGSILLNGKESEIAVCFMSSGELWVQEPSSQMQDKPLFYCDCDYNFDRFSATVKEKYRDLLGGDFTVLHFYADQTVGSNVN